MSGSGRGSTVRGFRFTDGRAWSPSAGGVVWRLDFSVAPAEAGVEAGGAVSSQDLERWCRRTQLVKGIGPVRQLRLQERGFGDLLALQRHPSYGEDARRAWACVLERRVDELRRRRVSDGELLSLFEVGELVFFDIETLGLAPVFPVFLAGFVRWSQGAWGCTLLLARTPAEEPALLDGIDRMLGTAGALVTYNGRGFDLPFLAMRRAVNGAPPPQGWPGVHVFDLLGEARRRFRGVLGDARLESVDRYLSWGTRPATIPSKMVPEHYRHFVETGDPAWIDPVLEHNLQDLLAMVRLWAAVVGAGRTVREAV